MHIIQIFDLIMFSLLYVYQYHLYLSYGRIPSYALVQGTVVLNQLIIWTVLVTSYLGLARLFMKHLKHWFVCHIYIYVFICIIAYINNLYIQIQIQIQIHTYTYRYINCTYNYSYTQKCMYTYPPAIPLKYPIYSATIIVSSARDFVIQIETFMMASRCSIFNTRGSYIFFKQLRPANSTLRLFNRWL
jgi:hypothetical protein